MAIGASANSGGQGTLDKVAGPVGEALIMTAIGLAVAIPAAVAYNAFARANRNTLAELNSFAHDLFNFLATGLKSAPQAGRRRRHLGAHHRPRRGQRSSRAAPEECRHDFASLNDDDGNEALAEINMIPLIDVMLVLLVIFIVTAPLLTHAVKVDLPKASSAPNLTKPDNVQLAIDGAGQVYWNGEASPPPVLANGCAPPRARRSPSCTCAPSARRPTKRSPRSCRPPRAKG
jgi:hypothetical protein